MKAILVIAYVVCVFGPSSKAGASLNCCMMNTGYAEGEVGAEMHGEGDGSRCQLQSTRKQRLECEAAEGSSRVFGSAAAQTIQSAGWDEQHEKEGHPSRGG